MQKANEKKVRLTRRLKVIYGRELFFSKNWLSVNSEKRVLKLALNNFIRRTCTFLCPRLSLRHQFPFRPLKWTFPRSVLFFCLDCGSHTTPYVWFHRLSSIQRKFFFLLTILILFCCCCSWLEKCFIDFLLYSKLYSGGILCRISFLNIVPWVKSQCNFYYCPK